MTTAQGAIGQAIGRLEGPEKVTGMAKYVRDMQPEGVLIGKCLRSPFPHARIRSIDASAARALPGVHAVITGMDISEALVGRSIRDIPVLARDVVRFVGEKVAAVAAESEEIAEEAMLLIDVDYEELQVVDDMMKALEPDAPLLHPNYNNYVARPAPQEKPSNLVAHQHYELGDVDAGFAEADRIFEHTFSTPHQHQAYLESHACLVTATDDERVDVKANSKMPFQLRKQLAEGIDLPESQIRVTPAIIGGDFGGKGSFMDTHIAYHLSRATGSPVSMSMDYIEEFLAGNPRHPSRITFKTGVKNDGTITARQATLYFNSGAYAAFKPSLTLTYGGLRAAGPYRVPNIKVDTYMVYTNMVPCGSLRAPGDPQTIFGAESQIDIIARDLGIDPCELRLNNLLRPGDLPPSGHHWTDMKGEETLCQACEAAGYGTEKLQGRRKIGRGIAMGERHIGGGDSRSQVMVELDGSVTLRTALPDTGAGMYTILRQIVSQELGVAPQDVNLLQWTTDETDFDSGVGGSRSTHVSGTATYMAASQTREKLVALAADLYGWPEETIVLGSGGLSSPGAAFISLADLAKRAGQPIEVTAHYSRTPHEVTSFVAQVAEVAVDPETGEVDLLRFTTAHDVGTIINPLAHQGQIEGAFCQGLGFALMEEIQQENARPTTVNFGDYKLPVAADIPELRTVLVQAEGGPGPYSSKGIGEHPIITVAAAIANAVEDAVGVRITDLPITAEKVYQALHSTE